MSLASYTICEEIQPRRLDASWIFRRPKLQNGARRDPRKWYEEKEDDTADFNIGTTHTHTHTQTRHAQRAQQAGVHFPQGLFRRLKVFNCQAGLYTIAFKSNTLIFDDTRQAQSDKDPQATIPKSTIFFYLYNT
jgi:hypothetical protein